ncbi:MAG: ABC transporter ATP-binding protein [Clostridia bacterium]|nr:ABC transporter ATP-binding protein [Clostridia bacterium]MBQ4586515.1 ABC transporter ATP-binding protein [Clostridia bacterium]MBQ6883557.1 ABC transporter ATP-binding protein [Clostridia bacterium]
MALLEIKNLVVSYGFITALKGIDINVEKGQIVALLGSNGAGKTTTLKTISGVIKPQAGKILLDGAEIDGKAPYKVAKVGVTQSPEGRLLFPELTVEDNLRVGGYTVKSKAELDKNFERVYNLFPILKERKKQMANTLSGGEQQMVAIGRALMSSPKILLLDEPSLGLAPLIIEEIFEAFKKINEEGTTILIVEQNALQTLKIADYAYVLELGKISMQGPADELIKDSRLVEAYLGGKN